MTIKEIFRKAQRDAEEYAKKNEMNFIIYMSGTKNKRTMLEKLLKEYKEDSNLDFDLGVINKERYDIEMRIYEILKKSIESYSGDDCMSRWITARKKNIKNPSKHKNRFRG